MTVAATVPAPALAMSATQLARLTVLFGLLFAAIVVGVIVVVLIKKNVLLAKEQEVPPYTLTELKDMHERGDIDEAEYKRLRKLIAERTRREALGGEGDEGGSGSDEKGGA